MPEDKNTIEYVPHCVMCEKHQSDLGIGLEWWVDVERKFSQLTTSEQLIVWKTFYEQTKLDQRTAQIQGYKKSNIKEINK
jgi:hypothetical protein